MASAHVTTRVKINIINWKNDAIEFNNGFNTQTYQKPLSYASILRESACTLHCILFPLAKLLVSRILCATPQHFRSPFHFYARPVALASVFFFYCTYLAQSIGKDNFRTVVRADPISLSALNDITYTISTAVAHSARSPLEKEKRERGKEAVAVWNPSNAGRLKKTRLAAIPFARRF